MALPPPNLDRVHKARIALMFMDNTMHAIRLQFKRIEEDNITLRKVVDVWKQAMKEGKDSPHWGDHQRTLFTDIHFLLESLGMFDAIFIMFEKTLPSEPEFPQIRTKYKSALKDYNTFRNHIEHIYQRVEEGVQDLGNIRGDRFTFNGRELDLSSASREVEAIYKEIVDAVGVIEKKYLT